VVTRPADALPRLARNLELVAFAASRSLVVMGWIATTVMGVAAVAMLIPS